MKIVHALFTRVNGGLEQAFVNDTEAFAALGHHVIAVVHPSAPYRSALEPFTADMLTVSPKGFYDVFAIARMRMYLRKTRPDLIIAHNGRAVTLMAYAAWGLGITVIGVTHSYKTTHVMNAHRLVVLSQHMHDHFKESGYQRPLHIIPNLMHLPPKAAVRAFGNPLCIGAMGRFSPEKGFHDFLHALKILRDRGHEFRVKLGGDGAELPRLKELETELGLRGSIEWLGWVQNKEEFFADIDVFCIPSHQDSLPMVMIEAMIHCKPIIATDALLPSGALKHGKNCLIVPVMQPVQIANALERAMTDEAFAGSLSDAAWDTVQRYDFATVSRQWRALLDAVAPRHNRQAATG